ncbi:MAG: phage baseplate assembly protein V [Gammaproteobacteria bacterium]|nr:phage baseplate assembly protein V [Gammaproteobacteria bacterium]
MLFEISWDALKNVDFDVVRFQGEESISRPFRYELTLHVTDELNESEILETLVEFCIAHKNITRFFNGYVISVHHIKEYVDSVNEYQVVLVPWFLLMDQNFKKRNFINKNVLEICREILSTNTLAHINFSCLANKYNTRAYTVQYDETDFRFVSRILFEEGIYYYFSQQHKKHELVLFDSNLVLPYYDGGQQLFHDGYGLEQLQSDKKVEYTYHAKGYCHELCPGLIVNIDDARKIIVKMIHTAEQINNVQRYCNKFSCVDRLDSIKIKQINKAIINGLQNAKAIEGCTRVQYAWGKSIKLPVSQYWAGCEWGSMMLPQPGDLAVLAYIDGDASRPVVLGCALTEMPHQHGFVTRHGDQLIFSSTHSEDLMLNISGDHEVDVPHNLTEAVGGDDTLTITQGHQLIDISHGEYGVSASKGVRFQVGDSFLELSPDRIIVHAAKITLN